MDLVTVTLQLTHLSGDEYRLRLTQEESGSGAVSSPLGSRIVTVTILAEVPANLALDASGQGKRLGEQLLANAAVTRALSNILAAADAQNRPVRLILDLPPQLQKLAWETLQLDDSGPIALRERLRLSRLLPTAGQRPVPHTIPDPLRVLTAVAAPTDLADYDLHRPDADHLYQLITDALPQANHRRSDGTLAALREGLADGADIFCLVCHGKLHEGQPYLLLAGADGKVALVEGQKLAALVADLEEQPRLAIIISCFGVAGASDAGDAAGALGPLLVDAGIPALVAMRQEFTEESAFALLPVLLREVGSDGAVDRALAAARWQIRERLDAWRPVLFARMKDGLLWDGEPPLPADTPSPYLDLRAFQETDKAFFFGRETVVETLLERIQTQPLLAVIGPSGSGKSSVVLAGLLPAVRDKTDWRVAVMRPGNDPIAALAAAFLSHLEPGWSELSFATRRQKQDLLKDELVAGKISIAELVEELQRTHSASHLLLVVDQFEELFSQSQAAGDFVRLLITPLKRQRPLKVVLTMRADFMGAALATPGLAAALDERLYPLGLMNRAELTQAITQPSLNVGARFEPGLVSYILDDVGEKSGNLPLLQFTLSRLWERRDGRT
ncbi:MAG: CHAT domain-containing protein, partial [Anaerolineales bacterium]|nr:CHAT domain-containing protein [Anaerolineales bacterium]